MMRMGSFILGGLVGAAALAYYSRNKNSMMFSFNKSSNSKFNEHTNEGGLEQIKKILQKDPELNKQVQDIISGHDQQHEYMTQ